MQYRYRENLFNEWNARSDLTRAELMQLASDSVAFQYVAYDKLIEQQDKIITNLRERLRIAGAVKLDSEYQI